MNAFLIIVGLLMIGGALYAMVTRYLPTNNSPEEHIDAITQGKISPDMNRWTAKKETKASQARADLAASIANESRNMGEVIRQRTVAGEQRIAFNALPQREQMEREEREARHDVYLETQAALLSEQQLRRQMLDMATDLGLPYVVFEQMLTKAKLDELELKRLAAENRITLEKGFIYQLRGFHQLMMMRKEIDSLVVEIDQIMSDEKLSEQAKKRQIAEREADIQTLKDRRNAERQRLVQADDRNQLGTGH